MYGTRIGYAIDISDALSVAHAAGIVHRNLKPANVVITEGGSAKMLDFGIAKVGVMDEAAAKHGSTTSALTEVSVLVGTIGYMSPEQAHGRPADARSDIFSPGGGGARDRAAQPAEVRLSRNGQRMAVGTYAAESSRPQLVPPTATGSPTAGC